MIAKQLALVAALLVVGFVVVSGLDFGEQDRQRTEGLQVALENPLNSEQTDSIENANDWELTDLRSQGSSLGTSSSFGLSNNSKLFADSNSFSATSTIATSTSLFYPEDEDLNRNEEVVNAEENRAEISQSKGDFALDVGSVIQAKAISKPKLEKSETSTDEQPEIDATEDVTPEEIVTDILISGHVITSTGNAVKSMPVTLQLVNASEEDKHRFGNQQKSSQTNAQGFYIFPNLVEGEYNICTAGSQGYVRVCQRPRAPLSSADFKLLSTSNGQVSGRVVDNSGVPLEDVEVSAIPNQNTRVTTDQGGQYLLPVNANANSTYYLYFKKENYAPARARVTGKQIFSDENKLPDTAMEKVSGVEVSGVINDSSGALVRGQRVRLSSSTVKSSYANNGISNQDGVFVIENVKPAVDYQLSVTTSSDYSFDKSSIGVVEVFSGMPDIQITLERAGKGSLGLQVVTAEGFSVVNEDFTVYNGSSSAGRGTTNDSGYVFFGNVSATGEQPTIRILNNSDPRYTFSGISLSNGESKTNLKALVDRGDYSFKCNGQR